MVKTKSIYCICYMVGSVSFIWDLPIQYFIIYTLEKVPTGTLYVISKEPKYKITYKRYKLEF